MNLNSVADITLKSHLQGMNKTLPISSAQALGGQFADALKQSLAQVNSSQLAADQAAVQVASGENKDLHSAMIRMEEADISLRLMVQVRNKAVEAYQEIMRMQV